MISEEVALIIPTFNAGKRWVTWLKMLSKQTLYPKFAIIIDSSSKDDTVYLAKQNNLNVVLISPEEFNHGETRQKGVEMFPQAKIFVFLTQDAILANELSIENLVQYFADENIGAVYGRQIPHEDAGYLESHARLFNYPAESKVKSMKDIPKLGMKTVFMSNSFAAYRRDALMEVGGFPKHTILSEDTYVAARMLLADWKIAYCAEAQVYHSHNYNFVQEFKRYFDIGVFHSRESWIREEFGQAEGEGLRFVFSEIRCVLSKGKWYLIFSIFIRTFLKYLGYRLGIHEKNIPLQWKKHLSMYKQYWN